jgi:hypothetical protein
MLTNTFCHIPTIGTGTEQRIWNAGVHNWESFQRAVHLPLPAKKTDWAKAHLDESACQLQSGNLRYFYEHLPASQHWRLFPHFRESVAYLDIETTGLGLAGDHVTTIALYDGRTVRTYVHGQNLSDFADDVRAYSLLVTYNGKQFDVPFLRNSLGVSLNQAHIDLRFVLASLGYKGGLKECEHHLGLNRGDVDGIDGFFAVLLWQEYRRRRDPAALETLLAYNVEDVVNLEALLVLAYNLKLRETPFAGTHALTCPPRPRVPFTADLATVNRLRRAHVFC